MIDWLISLDPALKAVLSILSILGALVGGAIAIVRYRRREIRSIVDEHGAEISGHVEGFRRSSDERFDLIERRVGDIEETLEDVDDRVKRVERGMETVARQSDVAQLDGSMREFRGAMSAQMRSVDGKVDTMYRAALAASQGRRPET